MKIIGIDPGTGRMGWSVLEAIHGKYRLLDCGCLETKANTPLPDRLSIIYDFLSELIRSSSPDAVAIEELYFSKNVTTAIDVGAARGVIILCARQANVLSFDYNPSQVKSSLVGNGKAEKHQIQFMVKAILKLKEIPKPDDAADAVAIALTHAFNSKS